MCLVITLSHFLTRKRKRRQGKSARKKLWGSANSRSLIWWREETMKTRLWEGKSILLTPTQILIKLAKPTNKTDSSHLFLKLHFWWKHWSSCMQFIVHVMKVLPSLIFNTLFTLWLYGLKGRLNDALLGCITNSQYGCAMDAEYMEGWMDWTSHIPIYYCSPSIHAYEWAEISNCQDELSTNSSDNLRIILWCMNKISDFINATD